MGGRRPPTIRCRRSSQGSLAYQQEQETLPAAAIPLTNGTESIRSSGRSKTPLPRPPPPVFRQPEPVTIPLLEFGRLKLRLIGHSAVASGKRRLGFRHGSSVVVFFRLADSIGSRNDARGGNHNDKKSAEDGEVVRRRTIITLGPRVVAPSGGSSSSINVTLLNGPVDSSSQPNLVKRYTEQPAEMSDRPRMPGSALSTPVVPSNNDANCSVSHVGTTAYGRHSQDSALIDVPLRRSFRCRSTIPSPTRPSNTDQQRRAGGRKRGTNVPNLTAPKQLISSRVCSTLPAAVRTCLQLGSSIARSTVSAPPSAPRPAPLRR